MLLICLDTVYQGQIFDTDSIYDAIPLNILNIKSEKSITTIYPNPAKDFITIDLDFTKEVKINIIDVFGKEIYSTTVVDQKTIALDDFANGLYFIEVYFDQNKIETKKIIISR